MLRVAGGKARDEGAGGGWKLSTVWLLVGDNVEGAVGPWEGSLAMPPAGLSGLRRSGRGRCQSGRTR